MILRTQIIYTGLQGARHENDFEPVHRTGLTLPANPPSRAAAQVLDRFAIQGAGTAVALRRLRFADLVSAGWGGAGNLRSGAVLEVQSSDFQRCSSTGVRRRPLISPSSPSCPRPAR